jgi:hypothetical protein
MDNLNFKQLPDLIITKIDAQLNSAKQAILGQAMCHDGVGMRLGTSEKKAASFYNQRLERVTRGPHLKIGRGITI